MANENALSELMSKLSVEAPTAQVVEIAKANWRHLDTVCKQLSQQLESPNKKNTQECINALRCFSALATEAMHYAEPFLIPHLAVILNVSGVKQTTPEVRQVAEEVSKTIGAHFSTNAVREVLPHLYKSADITSNWQTRVAALNMIASFADHAPDQLGFALPEVIPEVCKSIVDLKSEVAQSAEQAMVAGCDVVGNRDIEHLTKVILRSITHPDEVIEIMHKLAGVTFVQSVESPALAMVTPLLLRGLRSGNRATVRQSAVIIENMSKLVDHPLDAEPFLPLLMPALEKAADMLSDPEARAVAERSAAQLNRLDKLCKEHAAQKN